MEILNRLLNSQIRLQNEFVPGSNRRRHRILMISDFFYPNVGGVENHIYQLSQCLICQGHKVVVLTHAYDNCSGVRYLTNGLKVYYAPRIPVYQQSTLPTFFGTNLRLLRNIVWREQVTVIHAHQAFSTLALEACTHAHSFGFKNLCVVFTDHSLFGFADFSSILANKLLKAALGGAADAAICVSHTSKENTTLRACLAPSRIYTIPNAMDAEDFQPYTDSESLRRRRPSDPFPTSASQKASSTAHDDLIPTHKVEKREEEEEEKEEEEEEEKGEEERKEEEQQHKHKQQHEEEAYFRKDSMNVFFKAVSSSESDINDTDISDTARETSINFRMDSESDIGSDTTKRTDYGDSTIAYSDTAGSTATGASSRLSGRKKPVTIVVLNRLVYRKGVGLLAMALPEICRRHPGNAVRVIVGGDGPMKRVLGKVVHDAKLEAQVTLLNRSLPHEEVRDFLLQGDIFLSTSLTEAFGIALVEAAASGLIVVATAVGGVPEVLPSDMMILADPSPEGVIEAVDKAIARVHLQDPMAQHTRVRQMYNWNDVAYRTVKVYDSVVEEREGVNGRSRRDVGLVLRCRRYMACGLWIGFFFCVVASLCELYCRIVLDLFLDPFDRIDVAADWPLDATGFAENCAVMSRSSGTVPYEHTAMNSTIIDGTVPYEGTAMNSTAIDGTVASDSAIGNKGSGESVTAHSTRPSSQGHSVN